ncbi:MAG: adenylyltransferase/cytidyltransferase family protein [Planctomycetes bacterium]|nr:adenylyltransferase/cytidyltransferase family protein [Planctomycetota bacterium]
MEKIHKNIDELALVISGLRQSGKKVVLVPGVFDLLHPGHIRLLKDAAHRGDYLIIALQADEAARRARGAPRPILTFEDRAEVMSAFSFIHYVTIFSETDASAIVRKIKPDIVVRGHDFTEQSAPEAAAVAEVGGKIIIGGDSKLYSFSELFGSRRRGAAKAAE